MANRSTVTGRSWRQPFPASWQPVHPLDAIGVALAHLEKATVSTRVLPIISDETDNSSHANLPAILRCAQNASTL
jgi:hypothetical protein